MENAKEIIRALRCISDTEYRKKKECEECPYRVLEEVKPSNNVPYDAWIDGKQYWESCDYDRISTEAADVLEAFVKQTEE